MNGTAGSSGRFSFRGGTFGADPALPDEKTVTRLLAAADAAIDRDPDNRANWRDALASGRGLIHELFESGLDIATLLALHSRLLDHVLARQWQQAGALFDGLALVAVGGYGRGELFPHSDIDISILLPGEPDAELEAALAAWITSLWDYELDIGSSVRTIEQSLAAASADLTVITNLTEARLITGSSHLCKRLMDAIAPEHIWPADVFFKAKCEEQKRRHARFQTNAYRLEPNVKESQGGLRDFQTIAWVSHRLFDTPALEPLVTNGLLEPHELEHLREGLDLLWRIRYLLHHKTGRREDRLLFDHQRDIAHAFGYTDDERNASIEALMQRYYRSVMRLQRLNDILLQGIGGIISGVTAAADVVTLNPRFQLRNGFLETTSDTVFTEQPTALLELYLMFSLTHEAEKIRSPTVRQVRAALPQINARFRSDPQARSLFVRIFASEDKLTRTVRLMNQHGVLAAYLPAFDAIVGRMQYDLFHIYTVDEHTIHVIRNLRRFMLPRFDEEFPHCSEVAREVVEPWRLYLVALFHDIAKGRGGDHCVLGAEDMREFAVHHGLQRHDVELMEWTVRQHLLMSTTVQRRDIDDPEEQLEFAREVGSIEKLNFLYLLTVADIRGTNPELWNSFKATLLQALYRHARQIIERGLDNPEAVSEVVARRKQQAIALLADNGVSDSERQQLWNELGEDYFRSFQASDIARHTAQLASRVGDEVTEPLVALRHSRAKGVSEILVHTHDAPSLFATITTELGNLNLDIQSATITTTDSGYALDVFHVLENDGSLVNEERRSAAIEAALVRVLDASAALPRNLGGKPSRRQRQFRIATQVDCTTVDADTSELRVTAADRPGILGDIARRIHEAGFDVHAARISTLGERIDDVFLISSQNTDGTGGKHALDDRDRTALAAELERINA